ncbi:MAG: alkaline phosphatase D family protein, partial [Pseudomonadota bacterium]
DYGANDAGREFPFRRFAERIHENFWGLNAEPDVAGRDGTYYARSFGPEGQRVQVIMLDTRFFRSGLTGTDEWGAKGKERYVPSVDPAQTMLGDAQWSWLAEELSKPADIRLLVSSIQVLPEVHGYEAWSTMPLERQKLFSEIKASNAKGVLFVSGDRHTGFLYEDTAALDYTAFELTSSSLNKSFRDMSDEYDSRQIGDGVAVENIGDIHIDWDARKVKLALLNSAGTQLIEKVIGFEEIGL